MGIPIRRVVRCMALMVGAVALSTAAEAQTGLRAAGTESPAIQNAFDLFSRNPAKREAAINHFKTERDKAAVPILIQALRFSRWRRPQILEALRTITGENVGDSWHAWMLWQQARPEIKPPADFVRYKAALYAQIDPNFRLFLYPDIAHEIRLEEITWGGVRKDGIPALTNPKLIGAAEAKYLTPGELVFGVEINGDARAYPLRMMDWHEMFNDVIGGVPVSLAYCTLCGSGILFETSVKGRAKPFVFGSSGFLYRSNKLMYDTETNSLWNQFTGRPVVGKLTGSGIELKTRPVVITSWAKWVASHPKTRVLALDTGFERDYAPGKPYGDYFSSPDLMFPVQVDESRFKAKDYVFALRGMANQKAWPLFYFAKSPVINDTIGAIHVTLIGDPETRSVRAYRTGGEAFVQGPDAKSLKDGDRAWRITESALVGPDGKQHTRLPGHIAYWFAWSGYLGATGKVAEPPKS